MDGRRVGHAIVDGVSAAVLGGVVGAVVLRALMRVVALILGDPTEFSLVDTVAIVLVHVVLLLPGAVALASRTGRWAWIPYGLGVGVLLALAALIGAETVVGSDLPVGRWLLLVPVLLAMVAIYACLVTGVAWWARGGRRRIRRSHLQKAGRAAF